MPSGFKSNCYHCKKIVTSKQRYTTCSLCYLTSHQKCLGSDLSMNEYTFVSNNNYTCQNCATEVFPFHSLSDKEFMEEFFSGFEINASLLNEIFTESGQLTNCDIDFNNDEEISDNMIKEVYISAKEVNEFLENPGENINNNFRFSTLYINARSIVNPTNFSKIEGLIALLDHKPDVIGINETWEQPNSFGQYKCLTGYTFVSNGRMLQKGGGVGLYVKNNLNFHVCNDLTIMNEKFFESIFINIQFMNKEITCGTIYRSPQHSKDAFSKFFSQLQNALTILNKSKNKCFIMGDFNIDLLDIKNNNTENYVETMFDYNYYPLINKPTRITKNKCSSIDHIWTNVIGAQINSAILAHEIADHLPIIQVSSIGTPVLKTENKEWCFSELNLKRFYEMLKTKNFEEVYDMPNPDDSFKEFLREINPLLVSCFKRKKRQRKNLQRCVWYDRELLLLSRKKDRLYKIYLKKKTSISKDKYHKLRNYYFHMIKQKKKKAHAKSILKASKEHSKKLANDEKPLG